MYFILKTMTQFVTRGKWVNKKYLTTVLIFLLHSHGVMDARINNLSVPLYRILVKVGASERLRDLHQQTATTHEILETLDESFTTNKLITIHCCGSSYEGTVTPDLASDVDIIQCFNYSPVVLDVAASPPGRSYLMVCDRWTPPGYCKLQVVWNGQLLYNRHMLDPEQFGIDHEGRACRKHVKWDNMQGPASMFYENGVHITDTVAALKCETIPASSLQWIMRPRQNNFPCREQLQQMSRLGCMVVSVGHVKSSEHELDWRISLTLQERMLMSRLNATQHKVYILLKMVKKNIFNDRYHEESLSSYHFKICILYAVQMTPARAWTPFNLINCLLQCLKLMEQWLRAGHCPSFLIKDQNLFTKFTMLKSDPIRRRLLEVMRFIFQGGRQFLYLLHSDNVGAMLRDGESRMFREVRVNHKSAYLFKLKEWQIRVVNYDMLSLIQKMSGGRLDPFSLTHVLNMLKQEWRINDHTAVTSYSALEHLFPWLHLHIAKGLASLAVTCQDIAIKTRLDQMTQSHLHKARLSDLANTRLAIATIMYACDKYEECIILLQQIENEFTFNTILYCPCTQNHVAPVHHIRDVQARNRKLAKLPVHQITTSHTACCVVFMPSAAAIVPAPLKFEMLRSLGTPPGSRDEKKDFWFDWAVVDARVYIYFLQYLVSSKLQRDVYRQVARDNIQAEILEAEIYVMRNVRPKLFHRETAYNLLGWIYMQEGRLDEAFACFVNSLRIRPLHNAAKFHSRDLIAMMSDRRGQH